MCGSYLVSSRGWVVVRADLRGATGSGDAARAAVQGRLGQPETEDLMAVLRWGSTLVNQVQHV